MHTTLSIAGFDGSAGAGIQADLKTFSALGCYGTTVLTSLPIQNTQGVQAIYDIPTSCIEKQLRAILEDIPLFSIKIGMLHRKDIIEAIATILKDFRSVPIVLDPVMVAKSGDPLLLPDAVDAMQHLLFPITTVLTPNLFEASLLLGREIKHKDQMEQAAVDLISMGPKAVVVKGGHLKNSCDDCLGINEQKISLHWFLQKRVSTKNTHGTGCTFSAAIAAYLAKNFSIFDAVQAAKYYLTEAIQAGAGLNIGCGQGPVHHLWSLKS